MKFSFFSFTWLSSEERKLKKQELDLKKAELLLKEKGLEKKEEESLQKEFMAQVMAAPVKPYHSVRVIGKTCMVVLNDGTTLSKDDPELLGKVRQAQNEEEVIELFTKTEKVGEDVAEERVLVGRNLDVLKDHPDFIVEGENVRLKGVNLLIPPIVLASFIELLEKIEGEWNHDLKGSTTSDPVELEKQYEALKMFWYWTAMNPIESSRQSLIDFIRKNDITITTNGLLLMYRRVVKKKGKGNHELIQFISNQYAKIKKWKKSPKNYWVWAADDGTLELRDYGGGNGIEKNHGNLEDLYLDLPNMQIHSYTDAHTRTKDIRIGAIYKEDEDRIDLDNNVSCGAGLHVGSRAFGFSGFGDVGVVVLVNPMYVRSVPNHECSKMRVSEMFIVNEAELSEYEELVEDGEVLDYSKEYCSETLEELEQMLQDKKIDKISCQTNLPAISMVDVAAIKEMLRQRIVQI